MATLPRYSMVIASSADMMGGAGLRSQLKREGTN
jgi:hypothetical protein